MIISTNVNTHTMIQACENHCVHVNNASLGREGGYWQIISPMKGGGGYKEI
jgi:hypothetical protein